MEAFTKPQEVVKIGSIKVGGQLGEYPCVLIGSIFYDGHKIVSDHFKGVFDREKAEKLILAQDELSKVTGSPCMLDVVGTTEEAMIKHIDFVAETTKAPFLIDSPSPEVRIAAAKHVVETGLKGRAIYNSINRSSEEAEIESLANLTLPYAILFSYNIQSPTIQGRIEALKGTEKEEGLLEKARRARISHFLVDVSLLDTPDLGPAAKAIPIVKEEFGYPCGCGPGNVADMWSQRKNVEKTVLKACIAASSSFPIVMGANFILYGAIEHAPYVFYPCALTDAYIGYAMKWLGGGPKERNHPLYKVL